MKRDSDPRSPEEKEHWCCKDCGKDTFRTDKHYYMVTHGIWNKYGLGTGFGNRQAFPPVKEGMLCMDCMEDRLGRKIEAADLLDCPLNVEFNPYTKNIIKKYVQKILFIRNN